MTEYIKKTLNVAIRNLSSSSCCIASEIVTGRLKVYAWLENEVQIKNRIESVRKSIDHARSIGTYNPYTIDAYTCIFGERIPVGSICLFIEFWRDNQLTESWYFFGTKQTWFDKVYYCNLDEFSGRFHFREYDVPIPSVYHTEPVCELATDVYKAFSIEPNLFETYYDYQVCFYGKKGKIKCDLEIISEYEYECIDV